MNAPRIFIVDDAEGIRSYLTTLLEARGYAVDTAEDGRRALELLDAGAAPDLLILDMMMPGLDGLATLKEIRQRHSELPVVMLSVVGTASSIVEAMQLGANDYLNKPFDEADLECVLTRFLRSPGVVREAREPILWSGASLAKVRATIEQISDTDVTVLIQGESGTGKEVVARAVHKSSARSEQTFVKVNCAALPGTLLESELFGYEKGAFTGATGQRAGKFEQADGGTIFLDEIGEMSPAAQAKLLHVLQDGSFARLGGNKETSIDVRVLSATNRPLDELTKTGGFREDLFFRLNVVAIRIPPLRERRDEIDGLIEHFLDRYAAHYDRPRPQLSAALRAHIDRYAFPGNIRELENWIKRIIVLGSEDPILRDLVQGDSGQVRRSRNFLDLLKEVEETAGEVPLKEVGRRASQEAEREAIEQVLFHTGWNRKQAARLLGVSYKTLLLKIRESGLEPG
ncbi:MAG: sigma-54-dependent Fis family transcriptional regulator [bacterium]|nr:sigma-54-dependent Fis family transcriptional regulator [bacterium]MCP5070906.1 sigma-54-dependent Fis family transcriptional regulator [bacterium]